MNTPDLLMAYRFNTGHYSYITATGTWWRANVLFSRGSRYPAFFRIEEHASKIYKENQIGDFLQDLQPLAAASHFGTHGALLYDICRDFSTSDMQAWAVEQVKALAEFASDHNASVCDPDIRHLVALMFEQKALGPNLLHHHITGNGLVRYEFYGSLGTLQICPAALSSNGMKTFIVGVVGKKKHRFDTHVRNLLTNAMYNRGVNLVWHQCTIHGESMNDRLNAGNDLAIYVPQNVSFSYANPFLCGREYPYLQPDSCFPTTRTWHTKFFNNLKARADHPMHIWENGNVISRLHPSNLPLCGNNVQSYRMLLDAVIALTKLVYVKPFTFSEDKFVYPEINHKKLNVALLPSQCSKDIVIKVKSSTVPLNVIMDTVSQHMPGYTTHIVHW